VVTEQAWDYSVLTLTSSIEIEEEQQEEEVRGQD
jgi:hypothetical protein